MTDSTWVLTHLAIKMDSQHWFTCANCGNIEFEYNEDINSLSTYVLEDNPYCRKCGCRMHKDPQISLKLNQYYFTDTFWKNSELPPDVPSKIKRDWKVDEVIK